MQKLRSSFSAVLSVVLLFQSITVSAASAGFEGILSFENEQEAVFMSDENEEALEASEDADVLFELTENRSAYTKEYVLSDGLHMAVAYPEQVHYDNDGGWEDIDNTLVLKDGITSEYGAMLRMNRSIQAEGSFADVKEDMNFRRYLYRGKANALAESIILSMGRNINKLHCRIQSGRTGTHLFELKTA